MRRRSCTTKAGNVSMQAKWRRGVNKSGLDARYNDDKNAVNGTRRYRKAFNLPMNQRNTVELEVINKGGKDTSFVVISS